MYYLYLIFLFMYLGFFQLPMLTSLIDISYFALLFYSIYKYIHIRKDLPSFFRFSEYVIITFLLYYLFQLLSADTFGSAYHIFNIRPAYPIGFYFMTIVFIDSVDKLKQLIKYILIACVIGGVITIAQSLYGDTPLFDNTKFYNIGHWKGQMDMEGSIARVMLPTLYTITIVLLATILYQTIKGNSKKLLYLDISLIIPVFLSFARSLWLSCVVCIVLSLILLVRKKIIVLSGVVSKFFYFIIILFIVINLLPFISSDLEANVTKRFTSFFTDVENKSGTLETRLDFAEEALEMWGTSIWTGIDPFLMDRTELPLLSDVGVTYVLCTIGVIGLILLVFVWISQIILSFKILNIDTGEYNSNLYMSLSGIILFMSVVFWIISQHYMQYNFTMTLAYFLYGLSPAVYLILTNDDSIDYEDILSDD